MAPKRRDAPATRKLILQAAAAVYAENALAAPADDVWRRAGTTKGAVYHHFQDKATLTQKVIDEAQRRLALHLEKQEPGLQSFIDFGLTIGYWYPRDPFIGALLRLTADIRRDAHDISVPTEDWVERNRRMLIAADDRLELDERYSGGDEASDAALRLIARLTVEHWVGAVATPSNSADQVAQSVHGWYELILPTLANEATLGQLDRSAGRAAKLASNYRFFQATSNAD